MGESQAPDPTLVVARRAAGGVVWIFLAFGVAKVMSYVTTLSLARLLDPRDFGLVSFAMVVINASSILEDLGVPAAIIFGRREPKAVAGTAMTINIASALLLFGVIAVAAPTLAAVGGQPEIATIATVLGMSVVIGSLGSVQEAFFFRDMAFRRKFVPDVAGTFALGTVGIVAALLGFGVWSLVAAQLAKAAVYTTFLWLLSSIRPRPEFRPRVAAELLRYGGHVSVGSIVGFLVRNVDYFIVGSMLGATNLGVYTMAFTIANIPSTSFSQLIGKVVFPAYSRLRGEAASFLRMFEDVFTLVCVASVAMGIVIFVATPAYAQIVLSDKWSAVVTPLQALALYGVLRSIEVNFMPGYKAAGRPDVVWRFQVLRLIALAPALFLAARVGITAVAVAQSVIAAIFVPLNFLMFSRVTGTPIGRLWKLVYPQLAGSLGVAVLVAGIQLAPAAARFNETPVGAAVTSAAAIAIYAGIVAVLNRRVVGLAQACLASAIARLGRRDAARRLRPA